MRAPSWIDIKTCRRAVLRNAELLGRVVDSFVTAQLRDRLGNRFAFGAVLHSGPLPFTIDDRIAALPICTIWGPAH